MKKCSVWTIPFSILLHIMFKNNFYLILGMKRRSHQTCEHRKHSFVPLNSSISFNIFLSDNDNFSCGTYFIFCDYAIYFYRKGLPMAHTEKGVATCSPCWTANMVGAPIKYFLTIFEWYWKKDTIVSTCNPYTWAYI